MIKFSISLFIICVTCMINFSACSGIQISRYSKYNTFRYEAEQPSFNFRNDSLNVQGAWNWSSDARAVPKTQYVPRDVRKIFSKTSKQYGRLLFTTWSPNRRKFAVAGEVPVTRSDVRFSGERSRPFFISVFLNEHPFDNTEFNYRYLGQNNDAQFKLFIPEPVQPKSDLWQLNIIAARENQYFSFVCLADTSYMSTAEKRKYQQERFIEDVKTLFLEIG